jgi:hypothetical protein
MKRAGMPRAGAVINVSGRKPRSSASEAVQQISQQCSLKTYGPRTPREGDLGLHDPLGPHQQRPGTRGTALILASRTFSNIAVRCH